MSMLIADLILLQAVWKLYTFLIGLLCLRKRQSANICEGCQEARSNIDVTPQSAGEASASRTKAVDERKGLAALVVRHREPYQRSESYHRLISDDYVQSHATVSAKIAVACQDLEIC